MRYFIAGVLFIGGFFLIGFILDVIIRSVVKNLLLLDDDYDVD